MLACRLDQDEKPDFGLAANAADARMVGRMRLVLAVSVLLAVFLDPEGLSSTSRLTWLILLGYLAHSSVIYVYSHLDHLLSQTRLVHRLDVAWFAAMVGLTGSVNSFFFLFFLFAILVASFRWGLEEGARVTLASAALFAAGGLVLGPGGELPRLLLRTTFLLALGYMCVHWGESKLRLLRQLALLRDVSQLSNPRFGVDHTLTSILKKTGQFFAADSAILVVQDKESGEYFLRTLSTSDAAPPCQSERINGEIALPLLAWAQDQLVIHRRAPWAALAPLFEESLAAGGDGEHWHKLKDGSAADLAEMLEANAFISAPVRLRRQEGRIFITAQDRFFDKADALFLSHVAAQAFPVIENIELLDKMASDAAAQERKKMSLDLHDTALQPYIGLKLGLSAVRAKALDGNPLVPDIDKLIALTDKVIADLRHYAINLKSGLRPLEPVFLTVLRQQAAQARELYGVDVAISMDSDVAVSDRLGTEVVQMVREGLANICKHTPAQRGIIKIACVDGLLKIRIENETQGHALEAADFVPRSLSERAAGLGGTVQVTQAPQGNTVVDVEIPV